jgi:hypothetical protein
VTATPENEQEGRSIMSSTVTPTRPATRVTVVGLTLAAAGIVVLRLAGVTMPAVPPGLVLLIVAAVVVALVRRRWAPLVGIAVGLAELPAVVLSLDNLLAVDQPAIAVGTGLRVAGVVLAVVAGIVATAAGRRPAPTGDRPG